MVTSLLDEAGLSYRVLTYDRVRKRTRFSEFTSSTIFREVLFVCASGKKGASEGRADLQKRIKNTGIERRRDEYEFFRKKSHQSTFYNAVNWLEENGIIVTEPEKKERGGYRSVYKLRHNILLFKDSRDGWIPVVVFVCPERLIINEGSQATEQTLTALLPDSHICRGCQRKGNCAIHRSLSKVAEGKKDLLG